MFLALPIGLRQSEKKVHDKVAAEALSAAKVPITQINRHKRRGFLVRMESSEAVKRYEGTVVTLFKQKVTLKLYHVNQQRTFSISNFGVYSPEDVSKEIWEGEPFTTKILGIGDKALDLSLTYIADSYPEYEVRVVFENAIPEKYEQVGLLAENYLQFISTKDKGDPNTCRTLVIFNGETWKDWFAHQSAMDGHFLIFMSEVEDMMRDEAWWNEKNIL
ncbi:hypothetical protein FQN54_008705 [Arachnomyces sp. PD_36]|nr:hypothetical protein FQN54_008705 [Arachnomyces sp. PD_36]